MKLINNTGGATAEITDPAGGKRLLIDMGELSTVMNRSAGLNDTMDHVDIQMAMDNAGSIQMYGNHELNGVWYDTTQHDLTADRVNAAAWTPIVSDVNGHKALSLRLFRLPELGQGVRWVGLGEMTGVTPGAFSVWQTSHAAQFGALQGQSTNWKLQVAKITPATVSQAWGHTINNLGASVDAIAPNKYVEIDRWYTTAAGSRVITLDPKYKEIEVHQWCAGGASTYILAGSGLTIDGMYRDAQFHQWNVARTTAWVRINPAHLGNTHCRYRWFKSYDGWECDMTFVRRGYFSKALLHVLGDKPTVTFGNETGNTRPTFIHVMGTT